MKEVLLVDGYNMIGAWPDLSQLKESNQMEEARDRLLQRLSNYSAYQGLNTWVIFDAMFVPGLSKSYQKYRLKVVFTAEGQTADSYIEAMIDKHTDLLTQVTVATSDLAEQRLVFQKGAVRKSAMELLGDVEKTEKLIRYGEKTFDRGTQVSYQRHNPWNYHQIQALRCLLHDLEKH